MGFVAADLDTQPVSADERIEAVTYPELQPLAPAPEPARHPSEPVDPQVQQEIALVHAQQEGYQAGMLLAQQQTQLLASALSAAETARTEQVQAACRRLEHEAALMALEMAEQLICHQLDVRPELVVAVVKHALDEVAEAEEIHLILHPQDAELLAGQAEQLAGPTARLHLRPDETVTPGGVRVESDAGDVDATREGRLERLRLRLRDALGEQAAAQ